MNGIISRFENWLKYSRAKKIKQKIKEGIVRYGFLRFVIRCFLKFLKFVWHLFVFRGQKPKNPIKKIYQKWEEEWLSDEQDKEKAKEDSFFLLFKYDYEFTCMKVKENRNKNFRVKFICILPFILVTVLYLSAVIAYNINVYSQTKKNFSVFLEKADWSFSIYGTVFYVVAILITYVASKWLDVKQYQEAWNRHYEHEYAVEMEMFRYIYRRDEYYFDDRKQKFVENIMKTWNDNQKRFVENMKKEKSMKMDSMLKYIKGEKDE